MSTAGREGDDSDLIVVELASDDPSTSGSEGDDGAAAPISAAELADLPMPRLLRRHSLSIRCDRNKLVENSEYFRALLAGSFCESSMPNVRIRMERAVAIHAIRFMSGCPVNVSVENIFLLLEGALFFGVDALLKECKSWLTGMFSQMSPHSGNSLLAFILEIWSFSQEHGNNFIGEFAPGYLAQSFGIVVESTSFATVPFDLLLSSVGCSQLTVDSERQLCEALICWDSHNAKLFKLNGQSERHLEIFKQVRIPLLPLEFAAGVERLYRQLGIEIITPLLALFLEQPATLLSIITGDASESFRIRITRYSQRLVLSGCAQLTAAVLFLAVLPFDLDATLKRNFLSFMIKIENGTTEQDMVPDKPINILSFESVYEVNISRCSKLDIYIVIRWLKLAFPNLTVLRASHCLQFQVEHLLYLLQIHASIVEVDLTVDCSSVTMETKIISSSSEPRIFLNRNRHKVIDECLFAQVETRTSYNATFSTISRLILQGQSDINDSDIANISLLGVSLCHLNIKGCNRVTDACISSILRKCLKLNSVVFSCTSFGQNSVHALCLDSQSGSDGEYSDTMAFGLQELYLDGCKNIDTASMSKLLSHTYLLKILCARETVLSDDALEKFVGSSLECLDISDTAVSLSALAPLIRRNPELSSFKATGCKNLQLRDDLCANSDADFYGDLLAELSRNLAWEDVSLGWGFSCIRCEALFPAFSNLRRMTIGLGASVGESVFRDLPVLCPLLESLILTFQPISDVMLRSILQSSAHLRTLGLNFCFGDLTPSVFQVGMPSLRALTLKWVTPWMTNDDLTVLTWNCPNVIEFSLSGCKLLDSCSQEIISSGWTGLINLHLEDCGEITAGGVTQLFNCRGLQSLLLRHTGKGLQKNFINDAIAELPLLRLLSLDLCDACEGGFNGPEWHKKHSAKAVKISRCKSLDRIVEHQAPALLKRVHKETIILERTGRELRTTIVKERL